MSSMSLSCRIAPPAFGIRRSGFGIRVRFLRPESRIPSPESRLLLCVRVLRLDLPHDAVDELVPDAAAHALGKVLVVERAEGLAAATAVKHVGFERTFTHLLQHGAEEALSDPGLSLLHELVVCIQLSVSHARGTKGNESLR